MSARSVKATLINTTDQTLTLKSTSLPHGEWVTEPPPTIAPNGQGQWEADSSGILTGVEGTVEYHIGQGQNQSVSAYFDNPYAGPDQFIGTCIPPSAFSCAVTSSGGNDAVVTYTLAII